MKNSPVIKYISMMLLAVALIGPTQVTAKDISQVQLLQVMQSDQQVILLDVRTVEEFLSGHIADAVNIPHKELEARLAELSGAKNSQIVIYCRSGRRAEIAKQVLVKNGFSQLDHLSGDFNEWTSSSLPINKGK
ncbi:rhodanese-like domain-containing protein [Colwellia sp. TT2012]|uniref:rhodanese-like domain-containing protein n=1 Tax=Colwellia sp. TT2012 TaxID=1720342 RepID=UPI00070EE728|nr:rhodanese-like domain-containing protein [Colwellia sp. TT2012]